MIHPLREALAWGLLAAILVTACLVIFRLPGVAALIGGGAVVGAAYLGLVPAGSPTLDARRPAGSR